MRGNGRERGRGRKGRKGEEGKGEGEGGGKKGRGKVASWLLGGRTPLGRELIHFTTIVVRLRPEMITNSSIVRFIRMMRIVFLLLAPRYIPNVTKRST